LLDGKATSPARKMSSQAPVDTKVPENTVDRVDDIDIDPKEERALVCAPFFGYLISIESNFIPRYGVWICSS
jgi:hypothetical protein